MSVERLTKNLAGFRFGKLVVIKPGDAPRRWICQCDCGQKVEVIGGNLRRGLSRSCGCSQHVGTHGGSRTVEYGVWHSMIQRCTNPNNTGYANYGDRGIRVCKRWLQFAHFISDMGQRPKASLTLERVDNNGNYCPSNCVWASRLQQTQNRRRSANSLLGLYKHQGKSLTLSDWAKCSGIKLRTIQDRIRKCWPISSALDPRKYVRRNGVIRDREKRMARSAVNNAVRYGKISKPCSCQINGCRDTPEAHHHMGYGKAHRLDVRWLCRKHHKAAEGVRGRVEELFAK